MEPELFEALVEHINNEGSKIPIVVRSCNCSKIEGTHFEILDGENRYFAVQDRRVDLHEIPCIIETKNDVETRLETLNYNLEHEELVPEKFENLLKELQRTKSRTSSMSPLPTSRSSESPRRSQPIAQ